MPPYTQAPGARALAKERTRETLLSAGFVLAETTGLEGLSINALVDTAGVSKGTFFHHFGDRTSYLVALHRRFHDGILAEVQHAVAGIRPGRDRLATMSTTYLDACLRQRGVRALILEARGQLPIQDEIVRRNSSNVDFMAIDFVTMEWPRPRAAARLWIAANAECALIELDARRADPEARAALLDLLGGPQRDA
ncbi:TetR/AcrR family transcriptional regulator [Mycolicibacterium sp. CR10]|uniref:TetR/AcrR family transcriptional regulator n=1 Tax=Mycolicibacterium sp. CR10 TaxID=2562314 RepID=UPI0010C09D59|nr:TetR/AcrR family transcriptional regulator [Mycolicibacterium sp. CR10]